MKKTIITVILINRKRTCIGLGVVVTTPGWSKRVNKKIKMV